MPKFLRIFNKEIGGLHEAAYLLGFFAILSQILALIRDRLLAHYFGASSALDVYYGAFRIPDFIFASVASLVSISVLIPFLVERLDRNKEESKEFLNNIFTAFCLVILLVCIAAFFLIPTILNYILPGLSHGPERGELITLARLLLLSPIFLGISNFFGSITQSYRRFFIYALSPIVYNLSIIFGIIFLHPYFGIKGVVFGVVIGAFLHFLIQVPFAQKEKLIPRFVAHLNWQKVKQVVFLSLPRTIALSADSFSLLIVTAFASLMTAGSISIFNFALNLQSVPLAIVGVSYTLAAFPTLAKLYSRGDKNSFVEQIVTAARHIIFLSIPVTVLFIVLRAQIVRSVLGTGHFSWDNTRLTAAALSMFTISLFAQGLTLLFVRGYYAAGNTKKPLIINVLTTLGDIFFPYLLWISFNHFPMFRYFVESLLKVGDVPGTEVLMLPLGYSLGVLLNVLVFFIAFSRDFKDVGHRISQTFRESLAAGILMGFVAYLGLNIFDRVFDLNTLAGIFFQGLCSGILGIAFGILILKLLDNHEIEEIWRTLHSKIFKTKEVVVADQETPTS
jgi:putative peptidoglycan lipid II flippase